MDDKKFYKDLDRIIDMEKDSPEQIEAIIEAMDEHNLDQNDIRQELGDRQSERDMEQESKKQLIKGIEF